MNNVQQFLNETFGEVRAVIKEGEMWFVAKDICVALEYSESNVSSVISRLDEDQKTTLTLTTSGNYTTNVLCINEDGVYDVVTGATRKPKAKPFRRWITKTVIPAIRKDGAYISGEENVDMNDEQQEAEFVLKAMNILQNKVERLQKENKELRSKWDKFLETDGTYSFTEVSKLINTMSSEDKSDINITVIKLTELLREYGVLSKAKSKQGYKNLPNKDYEDYFNVSSVPTNGGFNKSQTKVKAKGVEFIYDLVKDKIAS